MNRLASALSLALVFTIAACGDDDKPPAVDTGVTGGTGGTAGASGAGGTGGTAGAGGTAGTDGGAPGACTGSFMGQTQTSLMAIIAAQPGPKNCAAAADVQLICTANISTIAGACGLNCLGMPMAAAQACVSACLKSRVSLTDACNGCYAATVVCTQMMCLMECASNPGALAKGCRSSFSTCSGVPTGPAPDGGAPGPDGGVDAAAPGDGGAPDVAVTPDTAAADTATVTPDTAAADTAATTD
jgi:hypothetical protein